jgi:hypothetical protein
LLFLRRASARLHARAALASASAHASPSLLSWIAATVRSLLLGIVWLALVAQIFVGQFLNHAWIAWLNHPLIALPWLPPFGARL